VLTSRHADVVAERFGLGPAHDLVGPVARGRLGEIWRLTSTTGQYAVKESRTAFDPVECERDAEYQDLVRATGVPMPAVVRTVAGEVVGDCDGQTVRVYEWVDVEPENRRLEPAAVGSVIARIHAARVATPEPVDPWSAEAVGGDRWGDLLDRLRAARAPFAERLAAILPQVLEVESLIAAPTEVQVCHRDLWADNLRASDGGLMVLDWENCGPASPVQEAAVALFEFGCDDPGRIRTLAEAYAVAGGVLPTTPGDFTMLIAQTDHIAETGCERWLVATTDHDREDNAAWVSEFLDDPVTAETVEQVLAALR